MNGNAWKVSIRLGKDGFSRALLETRGENGQILRSTVIFQSAEELEKLSKAHLEAVAACDPKEIARAHELAYEALKP